jgi:hypothetical protein
MIASPKALRRPILKLQRLRGDALEQAGSLHSTTARGTLVIIEGALLSFAGAELPAGGANSQATGRKPPGCGIVMGPVEYLCFHRASESD